MRNNVIIDKMIDIIEKFQSYVGDRHCLAFFYLLQLKIQVL